MNKSSIVRLRVAVYQLLLNHDYDEAAKQYLLLVHKNAATGDIKEAMQQTKRFLDTVICDEDLFGCISEVPASLMEADHWAPKFLVALLSLYAGKFEQALKYVEGVLVLHQCQEALYVKSRCLAKLGQYDEAGAAIGDVLDKPIPDAKLFYMTGMLNELHLGKQGLKLIQHLIAVRPRYNRGIITLRDMMKQKGLLLVKTFDEPRELVDDFNSEMTNEDFFQKLVISRAESPKDVEYLLRMIRRQEFEGEEMNNNV